MNVEVLVLVFLFLVQQSQAIDCDPVPGTPTLTPLGTGIGIHPGRVSWNWDSSGCTWDGTSNYWWTNDNVNQTIVDDLVSGVVLSVSGETDEKTAWDKIFRNFNKRKLGKDIGYDVGEKIAIKVNLNVDGGYEKFINANSVSPQFVKSVLKQLVYKAGIPAKFITWIPVYFWNEPEGFGDLFPDIQLRDTEGGEDYVEQVEVDTETMFYFSNPKVAAQKTSKLPKCLTDAKYVIEIDGFRGHTLAGLTMTGKNWFGSIYRPDINCSFSPTGLPGHWCPASLHQWVNMTGDQMSEGGGWGPIQLMGDYNALVDLLGHSSTAYGKGLIFFSDGLYSGQSQKLYSPPIKYDMAPFSGNWMCSVFASMDFLALDSVAFDFLRNEPNQPFAKIGCIDNYMHEAAQIPKPPSGIQYAPDGNPLTESLGVHEHWNNAKDMQYSRNLGRKEGIELIKVHEIKK